MLHIYAPSDEEKLVRSNTLDEQIIYSNMTCNQDLSPVEPRKNSENIEFLNDLLLKSEPKKVEDKDQIIADLR